MSSTEDWNEKGLVENKVIEHLQRLGYTYVPGGTLDAERHVQSEVVLRNRLADALKRLNPWLSENNLNKVLRSLRSEEHTYELQSRCHLVCRLLLRIKYNYQ